MLIAKTGEAIINDIPVPPSEVKVYLALKAMGRPATVPELAKEMKEVYSDASLYTLLGRLYEKRRLVDRRVVMVDVLGTQLRRIIWNASPVGQPNGVHVCNQDGTQRGGSYEFGSKSAATPRGTQAAVVRIPMGQKSG